MLRTLAILGTLSALALVDAFAQAPPVDPLVTDLQGAWNAKAYGDAQSLKAIDAILKDWQAAKAKVAELQKELDALKPKDAPK